MVNLNKTSTVDILSHLTYVVVIEFYSNLYLRTSEQHTLLHLAPLIGQVLLECAMFCGIGKVSISAFCKLVSYFTGKSRCRCTLKLERTWGETASLPVATLSKAIRQY